VQGGKLDGLDRLKRSATSTIALFHIHAGNPLLKDLGNNFKAQLEALSTVPESQRARVFIGENPVLCFAIESWWALEQRSYLEFFIGQVGGWVAGGWLGAWIAGWLAGKWE
jgi:hypothetical protein